MADFGLSRGLEDTDFYVGKAAANGERIQITILVARNVLNLVALWSLGWEAKNKSLPVLFPCLWVLHSVWPVAPPDLFHLIFNFEAKLQIF